jgi:hypothetical protein
VFAVPDRSPLETDLKDIRHSVPRTRRIGALLPRHERARRQKTRVFGMARPKAGRQDNQAALRIVSGRREGRACPCSLASCVAPSACHCHRRRRRAVTEPPQADDAIVRSKLRLAVALTSPSGRRQLFGQFGCFERSHVGFELLLDVNRRGVPTSIGEPSC